MQWWGVGWGGGLEALKAESQQWILDLAENCLRPAEPFPCMSISFSPESTDFHLILGASASPVFSSDLMSLGCCLNKSLRWAPVYAHEGNHFPHALNRRHTHSLHHPNTYI